MLLAIKENVLHVSQTVCSVSITSLCDIFTSELREHGVEPQSVIPFNSVKKRLVERLGTVCNFSGGLSSNGCVSSPSIQKENLELTEVSGRIVSVTVQYNKQVPCHNSYRIIAVTL